VRLIIFSSELIYIPMDSPTTQSGGRTKKHRRSRRRGGMSCGRKRGGMSCGRKMGGSAAMFGGRKTRRTHKKRGGSGMMRGFEGLVKTALVPFGLFAAQKTVQRRRK